MCDVDVVPVDMEEEEDQEGGGVANPGNKYTSQGID
jgi:hypothetical protein